MPYVQSTGEFLVRVERGRTRLKALVLLLAAAVAGALTYRVAAAQAPTLARGLEVPGVGVGGQGNADRYGDPLPRGALARLGTKRLRHGELVSSVAWSPDGKLIAAAEQAKLVRLWDPATGKEVGRLPIHAASVRRVAFSPDGKWLATAGRAPGITLWDTALLGRAGVKPRQLEGHPEGASAIAFAPDNRTLFSGGADGTVRAWDLPSGKEVRRFGEGKGRVTDIALAPDGKALASAHVAGDFGKTTATAHLWDPSTGAHVRQLGKAERSLYRIVFSPDGQTVATGGDDGPRLWKVASGAAAVALRGGPSCCYTPSIAFAPAGRTLVAGGARFLREWVVATGQTGRSFDVGASYVYSIAFAPDRKTMATGNTRTVGLWDVATGKPKHTFPGHEGDVSVVLFTAGGKELLTAGYGRPVLRWDLAGNPVGAWAAPTQWSAALVPSPDGRTLAAVGPNLAVVLLDAATGKERLRFTNHLPPRTSASTPMSFVFTPDGRRVISATQGVDRHIRAWAVDTGKEIFKIDTGKAWTSSLALSPDGRQLYAASRTGPVRVYDATTGKELRQFDKVGFGATQLQLSSDGRRLAAVAAADVCVWDAATGVELRRLPRPRGYRLHLTFSPDGRTLAGFSEEDTLRLWEVASGQVRLAVTGHEGPVRSVAFSRDGRLLATGGSDTTALLWDMRALPLAGERGTAANLDALWGDLASEDAGTAFRAVSRMCLIGGKAVALLAERLRPVEAKTLDRLIAQLDDGAFKVREAATRELTALGRAAEPALARALAGKPSAELRRRIERIRGNLAQGAAKETGRLRELRALEVLEGIASPEARKVLAAVGKGTPEAELTVEAKAGLQRLGAQPAPAP